MKKQLYSRLWMFRLYVLNKKGIENKKPACLLSLCAFDRDSDGPGVGELWRPRLRIRYIWRSTTPLCIFLIWVCFVVATGWMITRYYLVTSIFSTLNSGTVATTFCLSIPQTRCCYNTETTKTWTIYRTLCSWRKENLCSFPWTTTRPAWSRMVLIGRW